MSDARRERTPWGMPKQPGSWPEWLEHIERRIEAMSESGTPPTLERVEYMLKHGAAWALTHPLVWSVVREYWSPFHISEEAQAWRLRLAAALVEGLSQGTHAVTHVKPRAAAPGRAPSLFPKIGETHGWWETDRGRADTCDALRFRKIYSTLMAELKSAVAWRRVAWQYRRFVDRLQHPEGCEMLARDVVPAVRAAFEKYMREQGCHLCLPPMAQFAGSYEDWADLISTQHPFPSWATADLTDLLVRAFDEGRGNPRHYVTCELLTRVRFIRLDGRQIRKSTRLLIESTLRTIHKRDPLREFPWLQQPRRPRKHATQS